MAESLGERSVDEAFARVDADWAEPLGHGKHSVLVFDEPDAHSHEFAEEAIVEDMLCAEEVVVVRKEHNDRLLFLYELRRADKPLLKVEGINLLNEPPVLYVFSGVFHVSAENDISAVVGEILQIGLQR